MALAALVSTYGYATITAGTFLEGETVLILAGFAAHQGYLRLPWVLACAFLGTLFGDQLYFYIGRYKGSQFLRKRPHWQAKSARVSDLLYKHQLPLILGFRFLYGLRTLTPFLIGASCIAPIRFFVLNMIGALLWAVVIGVSGYMFGHVLESLIGRIERYEMWLFVAIALSGALAWSIHWVKMHAVVSDVVDEPRN